MKPEVEVDGDEVGFASAIGRFDSLVDTVGNERRGAMVDDSDDQMGGSSVLRLLRSRHGCARYVSTLTRSQQIVKDEGVLFGPGKANSYARDAGAAPPSKFVDLVPPRGFGPTTLQTLLDSGVLFSAKVAAGPAAASVRGWTMGDFWEETSWPRDSAGGMGVRYGLPVEEEEEDLDVAFQREMMEMSKPRRRVRIGGEGGMDGGETAAVARGDEMNPFVTQIVGVEGLAENVIARQRNSVVFVAMRSCRTCKKINPIFTKMARQGSGGDLMFAKADATGAAGKALGRQLGVVAAPSFVLFRNGVRYGAVSASRLPSERLDKAIRDLEAGEDFDPSLEEGDDD